MLPVLILLSCTFAVHGQVVQCYGLIYGKQVGTWHVGSVQYSCCCIHLLAEVTRPEKQEIGRRAMERSHILLHILPTIT